MTVPEPSAQRQKTDLNFEILCNFQGVRHTLGPREDSDIQEQLGGQSKKEKAKQNGDSGKSLGSDLSWMRGAVEKTVTAKVLAGDKAAWSS